MSTVMNLTFSEVEDFDIWTDMFFNNPLQSMIIEGRIFLLICSLSDIIFCDVAPISFWAALSEKDAVMDPLESVIVAVNRYLCIFRFYQPLLDIIWFLVLYDDTHRKVGVAVIPWALQNQFLPLSNIGSLQLGHSTWHQ